MSRTSFDLSSSLLSADTIQSSKLPAIFSGSNEAYDTAAQDEHKSKSCGMKKGVKLVFPFFHAQKSIFWLQVHNARCTTSSKCWIFASLKRKICMLEDNLNFPFFFLAPLVGLAWHAKSCCGGESSNFDFVVECVTHFWEAKQVQQRNRNQCLFRLPWFC